MCELALGALSFAAGDGDGDECSVLSACDSLLPLRLPFDALLFAGGVNGRNPSLELELPRFAGVDGPRASLGDMAGA